MSENNRIELANGLNVRGKFPEFSFFYKDKIIQPCCRNFAYVENKLIAVKTLKHVYIYSMQIENDTPKLITKFNIFSSPCFAKIQISDKLYIIDFNCNVTCCDSEEKVR